MMSCSDHNRTPLVPFQRVIAIRIHRAKKGLYGDQWEAYRSNLPSRVTLIFGWELTTRILSLWKTSKESGLFLCLFSFRVDCVLYFSWSVAGSMPQSTSIKLGGSFRLSMVDLLVPRRCPSWGVARAYPLDTHRKHEFAKVDLLSSWYASRILAVSFEKAWRKVLRMWRNGTLPKR